MTAFSCRQVSLSLCERARVRGFAQRRLALAAVLAALTACQQSPPSQSAQSTTPAATAPVAQATAAVATAAAATEPLPRDVAGVTLGVTFDEAQQKIGKLDCHDNPQGFRVCDPTAAPVGSPSKFELYLVRDRVVSIAYERDIGPNVWDFLNELMTRYGTPSLNGTNERDKQGRTHQIYGWKDDKSIFSVRFIWLGDEGARELSSTAITLWDRPAFQQWQDQRQREQSQPPEPAHGEST